MLNGLAKMVFNQNYQCKTIHVDMKMVSIMKNNSRETVKLFFKLIKTRQGASYHIGD